MTHSVQVMVMRAFGANDLCTSKLCKRSLMYAAPVWRYVNVTLQPAQPVARI